MRVHAFKDHRPVPVVRARRTDHRRVRDFRARGKLTLATARHDACVLCDGAIDRFDRHIFAASGHCCGCAAELAR